MSPKTLRRATGMRTHRQPPKYGYVPVDVILAPTPIAHGFWVDLADNVFVTDDFGLLVRVLITRAIHSMSYLQ